MSRDAATQIYWDQVYPNLPKRHAECLHALKALGRATSTEIQIAAGFPQRDSVSNRLHELTASGVITEDGLKQCEHTGNDVTAYRAIEGANEALDKEVLRKTRLAKAIRSVKRHSGARLVLLLEIPEKYAPKMPEAAAALEKAVQWMESKSGRDRPWHMGVLMTALQRGEWR